MEDKKTCFVITPIGNDDSEIRRHIDGIIDQAIVPALEEKYIIDVAHRKYEIGSINDRVIESVYKADLVIANLTNLNPNVMFELAVRYSFGKPAIVIAEKETKLPFDIIVENTVFYINDPAGANELKEKIIEFEKNIDFNNTNYGPIFKIISRIPLYSEVEEGKDVSSDKALSYIVNRLDSIEQRLKNPSKNKRPNDIVIELELSEPLKGWDDYKNKFINMIRAYGKNVLASDYTILGFKILFSGSAGYEHLLDLKEDIGIFMEEIGISDYKLSEAVL